jgi:hypothetical protein
MESALTDTAPEVRGGFSEVKPIDAPPELGRFVAAVRRLQDLTVLSHDVCRLRSARLSWG